MRSNSFGLNYVYWIFLHVLQIHSYLFYLFFFFSYPRGWPSSTESPGSIALWLLVRFTPREASVGEQKVGGEEVKFSIIWPSSPLEPPGDRGSSSLFLHWRPQFMWGAFCYSYSSGNCSTFVSSSLGVGVTSGCGYPWRCFSISYCCFLLIMPLFL